MKPDKIKIHFEQIEYDAVEFTNYLHPRIKVQPIYFELGFSSSSRIFGRYAVLHRLYKVINLLPEDYGVLIWDIYRPRSVQAKLFDWMKEEIRKKSPKLSDHEIHMETKKFMSEPSKIEDEYCPPHLSGGAIDLTLYHVSSGNLLDMGTPFDDCTALAASDYYNELAVLLDHEEQIKEHRNILRNAMESVGFTSYQHEWWHFDIGNIFWSKKMNCPEVFGPLFGNEEQADNKVRDIRES